MLYRTTAAASGHFRNRFEHLLDRCPLSHREVGGLGCLLNLKGLRGPDGLTSVCDYFDLEHEATPGG